MSVFLTISEERVIYRGDFFFMIYDAYPVSKNHLLIISNELREDYFSLTEEEQQELPKMINKAKSIIEEEINLSLVTKADKLSVSEIARERNLSLVTKAERISVSDIEMGKNAGMKTVFIHPELNNPAAADLVLKSLEELSQLLKILVSILCIVHLHNMKIADEKNLCY